MRLRASISKGEPVRFLAHLDFARAVERALRRARLPVAYSAGFNPHVKLAFASALGVGIIGLKEYFDVELTEPVVPTEYTSRLADALPAGITVGSAVIITPQHKALMAIVNYASYRIELPCIADDASAALTAVASFNAEDSVLFERITPKGVRQIDLKQYLVKPVEVTVVGNRLQLTFDVNITPQGSVKADAILSVLVERFNLPGFHELAVIKREALWVQHNGQLISPLEVGE